MGRVPEDECIVGDIPGENGTRAGEGVAADGDAAYYRDIGAEGCTLANVSMKELVSCFFNFRTGITVIREDDVRPDEDIVCGGNSIPDRDSVFYGDVVTKADAAFKKSVIAEVATRANTRTFHDVCEGPYSGAFADLFRFH